MKCNVCNNIIADGSKFCLYCGSPIAESQGKTNTVSSKLSMLEKVKIDDAITELYEKGNIKEAYDLISPIYEYHKYDEYVKNIYFSILIKYDSVSARSALENESENSLYKYLGLIDVNLNGDLLKVEHLLAEAEIKYPDNLLLMCRKAIFLYIAYIQIQSNTLLNEYNTVVSRLPDATNKIERTWKLKAQQIKDIYEKPYLFTNDYCKENDVYYNLFLSRISVSDDTLIVSKDGFGNYLSISEAINAASENTTIIIQDGIYNETININKPLILKGEGEQKPIIFLDDKCVCTINGKVEISNIDFSNSLNYVNDIISEYDLVEVSSDACFTNCNFLDSCSNGIDIKQDNIKVQFNNCSIEDCENYGIHCDKECSIVIKDCCFINNKNNALSLSKSKVEIENSNFSNNYGLSINIEDSSLLNVKSCDVSNSSQCGMNINNVEKVNIRDSKIYRCLKGGLNIQKAKSCNITSSSIYGTGSSALALDSINDSQINKTKIYNNIGIGIWITTDGKYKLSNCDIHNNQCDNIFVNGSSNVEIEDSSIKKSFGRGISLKDSSVCHCVNTVVVQNMKENIFIDDSSNTYFENCNISTSKDWGVVIHKDATNKFSKCNLDDNKGAIQLLDNSKSELSTCTISSYDDTICVLCSSSNETLIEYGSIGGSKLGVYIDNNSSLHIRGATITCCEKHCFFMNNAGNIDIENCRMDEFREAAIKAYNSNNINVRHVHIIAADSYFFIIKNNSKILFDNCKMRGITNQFTFDSSSEATFVNCRNPMRDIEKIEDQVINDDNPKIVY